MTPRRQGHRPFVDTAYAAPAGLSLGDGWRALRVSWRSPRIWVLVVLWAFGVLGDVATTLYALSLPGTQELNPIARSLMDISMGAWVAFSVAPFVVLLAAAAGTATTHGGRVMFTASWVLIVFKSIVVLNNLAVISS